MMTSKYIVLRVIFSLSLFLLSACEESNNEMTTYKDPVLSQTLDSSANGITFIMPETIFSASPSFILTIIQNTTDGECSYGEFFYVERKLKGQWYAVVFPDSVFYEFPNFRDSGLILKAKSKEFQTFSPSRLHLTLLPGQYRLVKTVICTAFQVQEITLAAPFKMENKVPARQKQKH